MKKYRFKINTPWGRKGEVSPDRVYITKNDLDSNWLVTKECYPDIFEEVEEKSDEELLRENILGAMNASDISCNDCALIAKLLILQGAINPEWLKKLKEKA